MHDMWYVTGGWNGWSRPLVDLFLSSLGGNEKCEVVHDFAFFWFSTACEGVQPGTDPPYS